MSHGMVEFFAYQETLLIMAVFGIAILAMIWIGFRRWLQSREKLDWLIAEQTAENAAKHRAHMERVEARLKAVEGIVNNGTAPAVAKIDTISKDAMPTGS